MQDKIEGAKVISPEGRDIQLERGANKGELNIEISPKEMKVNAKGFNREDTVSIIKEVLDTRAVYLWLMLFLILALLAIVCARTSTEFLKKVALLFSG